MKAPDSLWRPHWQPEDGRNAVISRIVHYNASRAPNRMPPQPWWQNLDPDFCDDDERFKLRPWDMVRVESTAAFDVVARTAASALLGVTAVPLGYNPKMMRRMLDDADFYKRIADQRDPKAFFADPPRGVRVKATPAKGSFFTPKDGVCEELTFESPFVPVNPRMRKDWSKLSRTNRAHIRFFRHHGKPRPTIVAIHGFMADLYALNEWLFAIPWFYAMGCNVAIFTLPFHGARQTSLSPFSGHGFFAGGLSRVNEAFAQGILDLRIFLNYLEDEHGIDKVGATGVSLGGYTTSIFAAVENRLAFAIPNVPVVSISDLVLEWEPIGTAMRTALKLTGVPIQEIRHILAPHTPLTYEPAIPKSRLMIIGGAGDRLAPPTHSRLLWDHWGRPRMHWYPGSHLIHLDKGYYLEHMARFMSDVGFLETPYVRTRRKLR